MKISKNVESVGWSPSEIAIMEYLKKNEARTAKYEEIAQSTGIHSSNVSRYITSLKSLGMVEVMKTGKVNHVSITDKGKEFDFLTPKQNFEELLGVAQEDLERAQTGFLTGFNSLDYALKQIGAEPDLSYLIAIGSEMDNMTTYEPTLRSVKISIDEALKKRDDILQQKIDDLEKQLKENKERSNDLEKELKKQEKELKSSTKNTMLDDDIKGSFNGLMKTFDAITDLLRKKGSSLSFQKFQELASENIDNKKLANAIKKVMK